MAARARRGGTLATGVLAVALVMSGCSRVPAAQVISPTSPGPVSAATSASAPVVTTAAPTATTPAPTATTPAPAVTRAPNKNRPSASDRLAGLRSRKVVWSGSGRLRVVPGKNAPKGRGRVYRIRIEVESGLNIDRAAFAKFVLDTLNDKRSWSEHGRRRFARTDGAADLRVILASPATSAALCRPLRTFGKLSCHVGDSAVLTSYRWTKAMAAYAGDHDGYRHYMVNHEVGHALGHAHEYCSGRGRMAPVMMQQTKGLRGCTPNPWPHP